MSARSLVDAIVENQQKNAIGSAQKSLTDDEVYATWLQYEAVDSALSRIRLADGTIVPGVRKYKHVTGLTSGDTIVCSGVGPTKVLTITGALEGDITLYEA